MHSKTHSFSTLGLTLLAVSSLSLVLSGCAGSGPPPYQIGQREPISLRDDGDMCGQSLVQNYLGLRANQTVREEVTRRSGAAIIRWIEPNAAVTLDFRAERLNAELDVDGVVVSLRCG